MVGAREEKLINHLIKNHSKVEIVGLDQDPDGYIDFLKYRGSFYRLWDKHVTKSRVEGIHQLNGKVIVTTGTREPRTAGETSLERLQELASIGIDYVIINDPNLGIQALR
ncbi:MAG: hypothetical protein Q9M91_04595 [Candidatus Dojkabacteria bacterium]|nr:hypothetical protein [Candidatus Dojkabacteria bacterium]MDQ7021090.1 hypothetical protein [Candidatus Dojkabacteria bacterium]